MKVFVSWTGADRDVKNVIVEKLKAVDLECYDSDEFCTSEYSSECIKAIDKSQVFIVIISDASMKKGYVLNEVIHARKLEDAGQLNILIYKITDSPFTEAFEFQLNHISFVTGNMILRKENIIGQSSIDTLINRTRKLIEKRLNGEPEKPFEVSLPIINGAKIKGGGYFVENSRDEVLAAMDEAFSRSNVIILNELFGYGKRSTVKKYVSLHDLEYKSKTIVNNPYDSLRQFFLRELEFSNINKNVFEGMDDSALLNLKFKQLGKLDRSHLLVIDNVQFENEPDTAVIDKLCELDCRIILITQNTVAKQYTDHFPVIRIGRMENRYLFELFFHHYDGVTESEMNDLMPVLEEFFEKIGGHTKTVELTASVLSRAEIRPENVSEHLLLNSEADAEFNDIIISQISSLFNIEKLSDDETVALIVASLTAVPNVSDEKFYKLLEECGIDDRKTVLPLHNQRWLDFDFTNRMISIEPIIAQIVLRKYSWAYGIFLICADSIVQSLQGLDMSLLFSISDLYAAMNRLENLLNSTGLSDMAGIPAAWKHCFLEDEQFDKEELKRKIAEFEAKYPIVSDEDKDDEEYYYPDELDGEVDLDFDEELDCETEQYGDERLDGESEADETESDEHAVVEYVFDKESYGRAISLSMRRLIPFAKMASSSAATFVGNFNYVESESLMSNIAADNNVSSYLEGMFGISTNELYEFLNAVKNSEGFSEIDLISGECIGAIYAIFNRDYSSLMSHIQTIFDVIEQEPERIDDDTAKQIFEIIIVVVTGLYKSAAYSSMIKFCERALQLENDVPERVMLNRMYAISLSASGEYSDRLYEAYETVLTRFDSVFLANTENRAEKLEEKKWLLLRYSLDLARGGLMDESVLKFEEAQKLGKELAADATVNSAEMIIKCFIGAGEFAAAAEFISRFFGKSQTEKLRDVCSEEAIAILEFFEQIRNGADSRSDGQNNNPMMYESYYQAYARENNGIGSQKYYSVAKRAMAINLSRLTNEQIKMHASELRKKAKRMRMMDIAPEAFALVSEAGKRVLGYKHHYVQYVGAAVMADGKIAEMLNGEGKTYTITLVAFLYSLYGKKVFVIDSSPFLTERNYKWMRGVYDLLGMSSACVINHKEDGVFTADGVQADVVYADFVNLTFLQLNCEIHEKNSAAWPVLDCAIIDEIDNTLVDKAKSPITFVNYVSDREALLIHDVAYKLAIEADYNEDYYLYDKGSVTFKPQMLSLIEKRFGLSYLNAAHATKLKKIESILRKAILCCHYYEKNKDYFIHNGAVVYEDKETGRFSSFSASNNYFLSLANDLNTYSLKNALSQKYEYTNWICVKDFFGKFKSVCGTTATAVSFRREFKELYGLDYVSVPPMNPCIRKDTTSAVYFSVIEKEYAIVDLVKEKHAKHQPILMVTESVEESEHFSELLEYEEIPHNLLNAKNVDQSAELLDMAGISDSVLITTSIANRGVDIKLGGNPEAITRKELVGMGVDITGLDEFIYSIPTKEQTETELYRKYYSVLQKNKLLAGKDREAVVASGGLCVICTSFFSEPRTEQQARGRSGRQGDVGESIVYISMEDKTMKQLISEESLQFIISFSEGLDTVDGSLLQGAIKRAQKNLHTAHFAAIRSNEDITAQIEPYRAEFIRKRRELCSGALNVEDFLQDWATDKYIHECMEKLKRGEGECDSYLLGVLYGKYKELIGNVSGSKLSAILLRLSIEELNELLTIPGVDKEKTIEVIRDILSVRLADAWGKYIGTVNDVYMYWNMKTSKKEAVSFIKKERERLYRDAVEGLFRLRKRVD